jgi:hypothetical protein
MLTAELTSKDAVREMFEWSVSQGLVVQASRITCIGSEPVEDLSIATAIRAIDPTTPGIVYRVHYEAYFAPWLRAVVATQLEKQRARIECL